MKTVALGLNGRDMLMIQVLLFCKREVIFETIFWIVVIKNQVLDKALPW